MKTFEEFITEEPVIKQLFKHYGEIYKRNMAPHPAKARRQNNQNLIDQYRLQFKISQDLTIPVGKRKKAADKAQNYLDQLKQELGIK